MTAVAAEDVFEAEPLKELASRTYGVYVIALGLLPGLVHRDDDDGAGLLTALSETGSMFAFDLAAAARDAYAHRDDDEVPCSLPRLLRLLADALSAFASVQNSTDVKTLVDILPKQAEVDALFDELMLEWSGERGIALSRPRPQKRERPHPRQSAQ